MARARALLASYLEPSGRFGVVTERDDILVIADQASIDLGDEAIVIGALFQRGGSGRLSALGGSMREMIIATRGDSLLSSYWGGYVAILVGPDRRRCDILRAPMGDLPCYYVNTADALFAGSDLDILIAAGAPLAGVSWPAIIRHLAATDMRRPETCISGVRELTGGQRLSATDDGVTVDARWSPWASAAPERQIFDSTEAMRRLRGAIDHSVAMQASIHERVLLMLSGGLDSSIVATALARADRPLTCVNLVAEDATSDERSYARAVAGALGCPLLERNRDLSSVDLTRSEAARLPRPSTRSFTQATAAIVRSVADETRATAVVHGGGGDNVFCSLQSARPAMDCLLDAKAAGQFWPTVATIASLAQVSIWTVAVRAWRLKRRWARHYPWPADLRFLSDDAVAAVGSIIDHQWLDAPGDALPGKAAHVALVAQAQSVAEGADVEDSVPSLSPLLTQPVVEACLGIPSWLWFDRDRNRAIARDTFADRLPRHVADRRSKGSPDGFIAALYETNRPLIRALLADGVLARAGLLDLTQVMAALDDPRPVVGHAHLRILQLIDAEAWARGWLDRA